MDDRQAQGSISRTRSTTKKPYNIYNIAKWMAKQNITGTVSDGTYTITITSIGAAKTLKSLAALPKPITISSPQEVKTSTQDLNKKLQELEAADRDLLFASAG